MKTKKSRKAQQGINGKMSIAEVLKKNPNAAEVLMDAGMGCMGCALASAESLEEGCEVHDIDVNEILKKLNKK
jgi:hydroxylamine reductase